MNKKTCLCLLFDDIDRDSRAKRALSVLTKRYHVSVIAWQKSSSDYYPYRLISFGNKAGRISQILFILTVFWLGLKLKPEVIYCGGLFPLIPGVLIKLFVKCSVIYDNREIYLLDEFGESIYSNSNRFIEGFLVPQCKLLISANEKRAIYMREYYGLGESVTYVNNIQKFQDLPEVPIPKSLKILASNNVRYLIYTGHLGSTRGLYLFIQALPHLHENIQFILIGRDYWMNNIQKLACEIGVEHRLHCCELLPLEELKSVLRHCHLGVITYGMKGLNNQYCAPNKLFEYAQSFLPMLTTAQETFKQVFKEHPIGQVIPESDWRNNDNKAVANIILDMLDNPPSAEFFENFNREFIWEKESKRFILALEKYVV